MREKSGGLLPRPNRALREGERRQSVSRWRAVHLVFEQSDGRAGDAVCTLRTHDGRHALSSLRGQPSRLAVGAQSVGILDVHRDSRRRPFPRDVHLFGIAVLKRPVRGGLVDGPVAQSIFGSLKGVSITRARSAGGVSRRAGRVSRRHPRLFDERADDGRHGVGDFDVGDAE